MMKTGQRVIGLWAMLTLFGAACSDDAVGDGGTDSATDSTTDSATDNDTDTGDISDTNGNGVPQIRPVGRCMIEQQGVQVCIAATGSDWTEGLAEAHCTDTVGGAYATEPCPATDCEGICIPTDDGNPGYEILYLFYTADGIPLDLACATIGTWYPGCN